MVTREEEREICKKMKKIRDEDHYTFKATGTAIGRVSIFVHSRRLLKSFPDLSCLCFEESERNHPSQIESTLLYSTSCDVDAPRRSFAMATLRVTERAPGDNKSFPLPSPVSVPHLPYLPVSCLAPWVLETFA